MTSDEPDAAPILADLTDHPRKRFEYTGEMRDFSEMELTPIVDWEEEGAWADLDVSELEDDDSNDG